jgi:hypothetical protein
MLAYLTCAKLRGRVTGMGCFFTSGLSDLTDTQQFRAMTERACRLQGWRTSKLSSAGGSLKQGRAQEDFDSSDYVWTPDEEAERSRLARSQVCVRVCARR